MTPADWLSCPDPAPMLTFLGRLANVRRLRLFAVACCRRVEDWLIDARSRRAVDVAERWVDGRSSVSEFNAAVDAADDAVEELTRQQEDAEYHVRVAAAGAASRSLAIAAATAAEYGAAQAASAAFHAATVFGQNAAAGPATEHAAQADLMRDLFRPFGTPRVPDAVLRWNTAAVPGLAQAIYDERAFDRLPILADALEDAGCDNADLLGHLRGSGPHVRGCWAVDLLLGKG
jgi:hypothetical protein